MGYREVREPSAKAMMLEDTYDFKNLVKKVAEYSSQGWRVAGTFTIPREQSTAFVLMVHD